MNPRQSSLIRYIQTTLNARSGEPQYKVVYEDEVPLAFVTPSIYVTPIQYDRITGSSGQSKREAVCALVLYRETRKKAHWDASCVIDALAVNGYKVPHYEGSTKTDSFLKIRDASVRMVEGGPTNVKAAVLTLVWHEWADIDKERGPLMQQINNELA
ncbi:MULTISPECIES: hypothetical protein [unclassified Exiguobacterium]|uniref:hypothetical protein n=1 Tax=unclassified Exiguobacterium TaxID=2644629 RepID=UPI001BEC71B9|nr:MULTISPECIES: hypothetical protein [unclassified Exiguobacterium]